MCWQIPDGLAANEVLAHENVDCSAIPNHAIIDVVHAGGLDRWGALQLSIDDESKLCQAMIDVCNRTVTEPVFRHKAKREEFPPLFNFYTYVNSLQKSGKLIKECESIAAKVWNGELARKQLQIRHAEQYAVEPSYEKYINAVNRMQEVWKLTDRDIDALRYFVCQCRDEDHNPSLNKSIYLHGEAKQTGKSTFARAFATVLNADKFDNFGKYESTFSNEMGYGTHDLPLACIYDCVILDEAMPKDTRKSYGSVKSVLTGKSFTYNPKFQLPVTIKARRNYFITSNEPADDFIQDRWERRIYAIEFKDKPTKMSFADIYSLIKDFCVNCEMRIEWQEWYDSFDMVSGVAEKDKNEVRQEIYNCIHFFQSRSTCTVKQVANELFKNEPTREQKKAVETAMTELADDCRYPSNKYLFDARKIAVKIAINNGIDVDADNNEAF